ncbi:MAG: hypothetical protein JJE52_16480 [Acidimicrobiia bacterium]|nr:hypothetical protein [Acidimicrobiia bacterium]
MRVTIETVIDAPTTDQFLELYRAAFDPLDGLAAGRQALSDEEFREEMELESVLKFIGWDRRERPAAMVVIATDLDVVPWISPEFWRRRFPEHAERNAIFYFGALLVSPTVRGGPWAHRMLSETVKYTARNRAVAAFDCCRHNVESVELPRMVADVAHALSYADTELVDTQSYYAYNLHGLRDPEAEIVLTTRDTDQIDLRSDVAATPTSTRK